MADLTTRRIRNAGCGWYLYLMSRQAGGQIVSGYQWADARAYIGSSRRASHPFGVIRRPAAS